MKKTAMWSLLLLMCLVLAGCGKEQKEEVIEGTRVYYVNEEGTKLEAVAFEPTGKSAKKQASQYLEQLAKEPEDVGKVSVFKHHVMVTNYKIDGQQIYLYFSAEYEELNPSEEILLRVAVVRTLTQINGIEGVYFYVMDAPLKDANGNLVGVMTNDSFVENTGEQINAIESKVITLYFSSPDGTKLVSETREVYGSSNISMEKLVMRHLMQGPVQSKLLQTIPAGTKLLSVSTLDGVCFVNLDAGFSKHNYEVTEEVTIYSIVNSLTELANVNKVQISINGDTKMTYRTDYSFETLYERNLDLVVPMEEVEQEEGEDEETDD